MYNNLATPESLFTSISTPQVNESFEDFTGYSTDAEDGDSIASYLVQQNWIIITGNVTCLWAQFLDQCFYTLVAVITPSAGVQIVPAHIINPVQAAQSIQQFMSVKYPSVNAHN